MLMFKNEELGLRKSEYDLDLYAGLNSNFSKTFSLGFSAEMIAPLMANIVGSINDDFLYGTPSADTISGLAGDDTIFGSAGADFIDGGDGFDTLDFSGSTSAIDVTLAVAGLGSGGDAAGDEYLSIERFIGTDFGDNIFISGRSTPEVFAGAGDDIIFGGLGNDFLDAGNGDDIITGGFGNDLIDGGDGIDTIAYAIAAADIIITDNLDGTYTVNASNGGFGGIDTVQNIEFIKVNEGVTDLVSLANYPVFTEGDDSGNGTAFSDDFSGLGGNDIINGRGGDDTLAGDNDDDTISGGEGNDQIDGGDGQDIAVFTGNYSDYEILNYGIGPIIITDMIGLDGEDSVVNIEIFRFADGDVNLSNLPPLFTEADDTVTATNRDEILNGLGGNDYINGGAGNDIIYGGEGNDTIQPGFGGDEIYAGNGDDTVILDSLNGDFSLSDIMDGGDGQDTLILSHHDPYSAVFNYFAIDLEEGVIYDYYGIQLPTTIPLITTASNFEHVDGSNQQVIVDYIFGTDGNNLIRGSNSVSYISGRDGDDELHGNDGDDHLQGGDGADLIHGGAGIDTIYYSPFAMNGNGYAASTIFGLSEGVTVNLETGLGAGGQAEGDRLFDIENISGTDQDDIFIGNNDGNILLGYWGNDSLTGGAGADVLDGGAGIDTADYSTAANGVWLDMLGLVGSRSDAVGDILIDIEILSGSDFNDRFYGSNELNSLYGRGGDDALFGRNGDDWLEGGSGADMLIGGQGIDTAGYGDAATGVTADLMGLIAGVGEAVGDQFFSIEALSGSDFNDRLYGDNGDNALDGQDGNDRLFGRSGDDDIDGGAGNDVIVGGNGDDELSGGAGINHLFGGAGVDHFTFDYVGGGNDIIHDFDATSEMISVLGIIGNFTSITSILDLASDVGGDVLIDFGNGNSIILLGLSVADLSDGNFDLPAPVVAEHIGELDGLI